LINVWRNLPSSAWTGHGASPRPSTSSFSFFSSQDVVRHPLVQRVISAYEDYERLSGKP